MLRLSILAAGLLSLALAECPNGCSGHGLCRERDQCHCEPNYFGGDCSLRSCPHHYAFVDIPLGDLNHDGVVSGQGYVSPGLTGSYSYHKFPAYEAFPTDATKGGFAAQDNEGHFYMECSGKGECDRNTGRCKCYEGYTGSACQRSTCANDCSGHGLCRTLREVAAGALSRRATGSDGGNLIMTGVRESFDYNLWDADKHQMCICDPGYEGIDCSLRTCQRGDDPLTPHTERWCGGEVCSPEVQAFTLPDQADTSYKFSFTDLRNNTMVAYATLHVAAPAVCGEITPANLGTHIAGPTTTAGIMMNALRSIPGGLLQHVEVRCTGSAIPPASGKDFEITFHGLSGDQYMLDIVNVDTEEPIEVTELIRGNIEDIECSGRGLCDRDTGLCQCFNGYYGVACEFQNALAGSPHH